MAINSWPGSRRGRTQLDRPIKTDGPLSQQRQRQIPIQEPGPCLPCHRPLDQPSIRSISDSICIGPLFHCCSYHLAGVAFIKYDSTRPATTSATSAACYRCSKCHSFRQAGRRLNQMSGRVHHFPVTCRLHSIISRGAATVCVSFCAHQANHRSFLPSAAKNNDIGPAESLCLRTSLLFPADNFTTQVNLCH